jgi:hypothetical protein
VRFRGAQIKRGGQKCGLVIVTRAALTDNIEADRLITALQNEVFHTPAVVLMAQDSQLGPVFYGRADLVRFLETLDVSQIRWAEYTITSSARHATKREGRNQSQFAAHK